ncbi:alpha/beta hydrolase [Oceanicella actignis]|uniref:alpha/beta hydrolase n=1 Tax=Oceanicella actignis TaxID=1189325 RepID=UPI001256FCD1|nr:alpha/beta hydrolase [Oceanicella actignis]TYO84799.1 acetyl esterase/lipase [Oceanicella actignis]
MSAAAGLAWTDPPADWDDAYANAAHIPGAEAFLRRWPESAARFRAGARALTDLPYADHPRARYDLFLPEGAPRGLAVFIHGGYWMRFDKSDWSHLAAGATARGWAMALPSYPLAPEARIGAIAGFAARFLEAAAARVAGPIRLAGHSAGGHLAARLVCAGADQAPPLAPAALARVERVVSISGLHDLRPLLRTAMNATLRLDEAEAAAHSPALLRPASGVAAAAWVGADERPEFLRQAALLANVWRGLGARTALHAAPGRHHFDVIEGLTRPDDPLCDALLSD